MTQLSKIRFRRRAKAQALEARLFVNAMAHGLYFSGGTTWRCTRCKALARADGAGRLDGCECEGSSAIPLEPTDANFYKRNDIEPPHHLKNDAAKIAALENQVEILSAIIERQSEVTQAARHLMQVMTMRGENGPVFHLNRDPEEEIEPAEAANISIIGHAVLDLQAKLDGTELPHFCIPGKPH